MNDLNYTRKSQEALIAAQRLGQEHGAPQIEQPHLLFALLDQPEGLIPQLITAMGPAPESLRAAAKQAIDQLPKVSGSGREAGRVYVSPDTDAALQAAAREAAAMKDEFVSVEHLFLGLLSHPDRTLSRLFQTYQLNREKALTALASVRGHQRVTSDSPEDTYDALKKYGTDLVERARQQKLDPVIGRDDEIRNVIRILSRKTKNNPVLIG
ncbi:MAG: type VI secretion system ATPase TssH, partial [Oscillospiraceae bacterium]|nr:type VI secretion system ATPase TssH [Oscillospiraceae bacterium]